MYGSRSITASASKKPTADNDFREMILRYGYFLWASSVALTTLLQGLSVRQDAPISKSINGTYSGRYDSARHQDVFLGIPYAQPPLGDFRFRRPVSLNHSWDGTRDAKNFGYICYQSGNRTDMNEDCLTLNGKLPHPENYSLLGLATNLIECSFSISWTE